MIKNSKYILILIFFAAIIFNNLPAVSKVTVSIPDTAIVRGSIYNIAVKSTSLNPVNNNIKLILSFNAYLLDIKGVTGGPTYAMRCTSPNMTLNFTKLDSAVVEISCDDVLPINDGIICMLQIEALAGPDSTAYLYPQKIYLDGSEPNESSYIPGKFKIIGAPVYPTFPEGLEQNYPNPFDTYTKFPFNISKQTSVTFYIYNSLGMLLTSSDKNPKSIIIKQLTKEGEIIIENLQAKLEKGNYLLQYSPLITEFSSGKYFLLMRTEYGVYVTSFVCAK